MHEPCLRIAECLRAAGDAAQAEKVLREGLSSGSHDFEALWDLWITLSILDLRRTPGEALAAFPLQAQGGDIEDSTRRGEMHWLLSTLQGGQPVRINCGGLEHKSQDGRLWARDAFFTGGSVYCGHHFSKRKFPAPGRQYEKEIAGTEDAPLYQTERFFPFGGRPGGYRIPLPPGRYRVSLHFAEIVTSDSGGRRFDVRLEGRPILEDYEPLAAGFATAEKKTFEVTVEDGFFDIEFIHRTGDPKISALEIETLRGKE
jgi:hypothetical protein